MRRTLIGLATAGILGTTLLTVPPALAARSITPSVARAAESVAVARTVAVTTAATTVAASSTPCNYPTNTTTLGIRPLRGVYYRTNVYISFHGYLMLNKCPLHHKRIVLHRGNGTVVGSGYTDAKGFYSIRVAVPQTRYFYATFAGDSKYKKARSATAYIQIKK